MRIHQDSPAKCWTPSVRGATFALLVAFAQWLSTAMPAGAVVVISDGFGDADLDNNGTALELYDVDISSAGDGTIGTYEPVQNGLLDTIFADGVTVQEVNAVEDSSDRGIPWYFISGFTTGTSPDPKVNAKIINDAAAFALHSLWQASA